MRTRLCLLMIAVAAGLAWPAMAAAPPPAPEKPPAVDPTDLPPVNSGLMAIIPVPVNCAPPSLVRMVVRNVTPGLQAAAPAAQPRTLYRQGSDFMRIENAVDVMRGVQAVTVVAEPEIWEIEIGPGVARHSRDPGPIFTVQAPVVAGPGLSPAFNGLEFGCEMAFIAKASPIPSRQIGQGTNQINVHVIAQGDETLAVLVDATRHLPLMISLAKGGRPVVVMRYDSYDVIAQPRPQLFAPPKNIRIMEAPQVGPPAPPSPFGPPVPQTQQPLAPNQKGF